jgi:hypothetical protein
MDLDLTGEKASSAGAEVTEPARGRHIYRYNKQGTAEAADECADMPSKGPVGIKPCGSVCKFCR